MRYLVGLILTFICFTASLSWAEEGQKTISGTVTETDWVSSSISVRYFPDFSTDADELDLKVTSDAKMRRDTDAISFSDIEINDPVTATYFDDGLSGLKIKTLTDLNSGNK